MKSEIILNTPIVLYTRSAVAQALVDSGIASQTDGVYTVDMVKLTEAIEAGTAWADIGLPQLAMHSPYETAGTKDTGYFCEVAKKFFSSSVQMKANGIYEIR